jgi:hypothetical protein
LIYTFLSQHTIAEVVLLHHLLYILTTQPATFLMMAGVWISRLLRTNLMSDVLIMRMKVSCKKPNDETNIPLITTKFYYKGKWNEGWINVVNPFELP